MDNQDKTKLGKFNPKEEQTSGKPITNAENTTSESKKEEAVVSEEKIVSVPASLLASMMKHIENNSKETNKLISALTETIKNQSSNNGQIYTSEIEEFDPEDLMAVPAMFFSYDFKYAIYDDVRFGKVVNPPAGKIKFNPIHRDVKKVGGKNAPIYNNMSIAIIYSKKQYEYLRSHSLFGIKFFENVKQASEVNHDESMALVDAYNSISSLSSYQLRNRCLSEGIKIESSDDGELRKKLAIKIGKEILKRNQEILNRNTTSSLKREVEVLE